MSPPAFLALGDVHLDPLIWKRHPMICGDAFAGFESFVKIGLEHGIPLVILGDLFDSVDPDPSLIRFFRSQMDLCQTAKIEVFAIQGNHDKRPVPWYTAVHSWPRHLGDGSCSILGGLKVRGYDYALRDEISSQIAPVPRETDILLLHQAAKQRLPREGAWNLDLEQIPKSISLVMLGHIHDPWMFDLGDKRRALYTGSSHPRSVSEFGDKRCVIVNSDLSVKSIPLGGRQFRLFSIQEEKDVEEINTWLKSVHADTLKPVAWVRHLPGVAGRLMQLRSDLLSTGFIVLDAVYEVVEVKEDPARAAAPALTLEYALERYVKPDEDPDVHSLILSALDPQGQARSAIHKQREGFLKTYKPI